MWEETESPGKTQADVGEHGDSTQRPQLGIDFFLINVLTKQKTTKKRKRKKKLNEMFFKNCCVYFPHSLFLTWSAAFNRWNFEETYLNENILADRVWGCQDCAVGEDTAQKAVLSGS